jgi:DnaJ-class molecular chaperone
MMRRWLANLTLFGLLLAAHPSAAFVTPQQAGHPWPAGPLAAARSAHRAERAERSFLLQEFSIASGEVINPYDILKVSRKATREQVRDSYIALSRRYHPDGYRHRKILPGSCNNLDEVRDQWERIKLAYEILSNPKTRKRYDRHEALADPGAAVQRAAVNAAFQGISGMGKGLLDMGAFAVQSLNSKNGSSQKVQEAATD